jgi:hypothetical protein
MPTTRTQQKLLDKEIDFNRKDEHNNKVTIIKKWGTPDRYLDQYFNTKEKWDTLNIHTIYYTFYKIKHRKKETYTKLEYQRVVFD